MEYLDFAWSKHNMGAYIPWSFFKSVIRSYYDFFIASDIENETALVYFRFFLYLTKFMKKVFSGKSFEFLHSIILNHSWVSEFWIWVGTSSPTGQSNQYSINTENKKLVYIRFGNIFWKCKTDMKWIDKAHISWYNYNLA